MMTKEASRSPERGIEAPSGKTRAAPPSDDPLAASLRGFGPLGILAIVWMPMFAHAAFDWAAIAIIYWDLESKVAHLVFK